MKTISLLLLSAALLLLSGCTAGRVALTNPSWETNYGYAVEGRAQTVLQKKPLRFGEFHTTSVQTSWKQSSAMIADLDGRMMRKYDNTLGVLYERSKSSRRFKMSNGHDEHQSLVYTFNRLNSSTYLLGKSAELNFDWLLRSLGMSTKTENSYYVQVFEPGTEKPWELLLDMDAVELNAKNYAGYFALDDEHFYTLKPIIHLMGKSAPMRIPVGCIGYEVSDNQAGP